MSICIEGELLRPPEPHMLGQGWILLFMVRATPLPIEIKQRCKDHADAHKQAENYPCRARVQTMVAGLRQRTDHGEACLVADGVEWVALV